MRWFIFLIINVCIYYLWNEKVIAITTTNSNKKYNQPPWNAFFLMKTSGSMRIPLSCVSSGPDVSVIACATLSLIPGFMVYLSASLSGLSSPWIQKLCLCNEHSLLSFLIFTPFWQLSQLKFNPQVTAVPSTDHACQ